MIAIRSDSRRILRWVASALFGLVLLAPILGYKFAPGTAEIGEKRAKAAFPRTGVEAEAWKAGVEAYLGDRLGFRSLLIPLHALLEIHLLKKITSPNVLVGSQGWYYYFHNQYNWDEARGDFPLDRAALLRIKERLEANQRLLEAVGCKYLFVIAPDKHTIYPEYLPRSYRERVRPTRREQFARLVAEVGLKAQILDLTDELSARKRGLTGDLPLYYKTDSHWNQLGAFYATRAIVEKLRSPELGLSEEEIFGIPELQDYDRVSIPPFGGDLAIKLGAANYIREESFALETRLGAGVADPARRLWTKLRSPARPEQIAMMTDSFGGGIVYHLQRYLRTIVTEGHQNGSNPDGTTRAVDLNFVRRVSAKVLIHEVVERDLERLLWEEPAGSS